MGTSGDGEGGTDLATNVIVRAAGVYLKLTLADLGVPVVEDGMTAYAVTAYGLPAGLKLMSSPAVTKKVKVKSKGKWVWKTLILTPAKVHWWIEGVPTAAVDNATNPAYVKVTQNGVATLYPLNLSVTPQTVTDLGDLPLGAAVKETDWLPGVTKGWLVSGLPTGLKYSGDLALVTRKLVNKARKLYSVTTNMPAFTVYGTPTKAGVFAVTAKRKTNGFYESLKYRVRVTPKTIDATVFGVALTNLMTTAHEPFTWNLADDVAATNGAVAKVVGLPTGLTFSAKAVYGYANAREKTGKYLKQAGQTIVGTPTKAGTYVVTFTKNVKIGKKTVAKTGQILWTVVANPARPTLAFNEAGGTVREGDIGVTSAGLAAFTADRGSVVTASGLPSGVTLVNLGNGTWGFKGFTAKTGIYLVTVKATVKGNAVTQRLALRVAALPAWARGTFDGSEEVEGENASQMGVVRLSIGTTGKISGTLREDGTNWTFSAACYTGAADGAYLCTNVVAKSAYTVVFLHVEEEALPSLYLQSDGSARRSGGG